MEVARCRSLLNITLKLLQEIRKDDQTAGLYPFNVHDGLIDVAQHPRQVYLTVIAPREVKGPHLHLKRWGLFTCIRGNAKIVVRNEKGYEEYLTGEDYEFATIQVPAGVSAALQNIGDEEAYMLNTCHHRPGMLMNRMSIWHLLTIILLHGPWGNKLCRPLSA